MYSIRLAQMIISRNGDLIRVPAEFTREVRRRVDKLAWRVRRREGGGRERSDGEAWIGGVPSRDIAADVGVSWQAPVPVVLALEVVERKLGVGGHERRGSVGRGERLVGWGGRRDLDDGWPIDDGERDVDDGRSGLRYGRNGGRGCDRFPRLGGDTALIQERVTGTAGTRRKVNSIAAQIAISLRGSVGGKGVV